MARCVEMSRADITRDWGSCLPSSDKLRRDAKDGHRGNEHDSAQSFGTVFAGSRVGRTPMGGVGMAHLAPNLGINSRTTEGVYKLTLTRIEMLRARSFGLQANQDRRKTQPEWEVQ